MGTMLDAIKIAYDKGYRITEDGKLIGLNGKELIIACRGKQRYPTFSVNGVPGVNNKYGVFGIPIHKFAAYCFYGNKVEESECVRHLNGNVLDVSKNNIVLGTNSENEKDKDPAVRSSSAKTARSAQPYRAHNHRFTDDQIRYIRNNYPDKNYKELGEEFGVTRSCIFRIVKGLNYGDVT